MVGVVGSKYRTGRRRIVVALAAFVPPLAGCSSPSLPSFTTPSWFTSSSASSTTGNSARFTPLRSEEMTDRQKALVDLVESGKLEGGIAGPLAMLLRSPELGEAILRYGAYERFHMPLPAKLSLLR